MMPNIWSWPAWAGPRERSVQWWPPQESAGPGVEQWDIVGGGRILISRLGPLVVELFHCYSWQMFPNYFHVLNTAITFQELTREGDPEEQWTWPPGRSDALGSLAAHQARWKEAAWGSCCAWGGRGEGNENYFHLRFYDLELDWCHNATQAGSGEESEEEEDDSDGEEGPRGRMCTQS